MYMGGLDDRGFYFMHALTLFLELAAPGLSSGSPRCPWFP